MENKKLSEKAMAVAQLPDFQRIITSFYKAIGRQVPGIRMNIPKKWKRTPEETKTEAVAEKIVAVTIASHCSETEMDLILKKEMDPEEYRTKLLAIYSYTYEEENYTAAFKAIAQ